MALTTKRIINLPTQNDPQSGDYLAIDNGTNGTHKIPVGRIGVELDDTLSVSGKAADAKATGDAIDELRTQLEVTGTSSGTIATFSDGSTMPTKSCTAQIVPKQSGSGTPSPDNVRTISGWESVSVKQTGKNLFNPNIESKTVSGVTYSYSDGGILLNGTKVGGNTADLTSVVMDFPSGTYTFSGSLVSGTIKKNNANYNNITASLVDEGGNATPIGQLFESKTITLSKSIRAYLRLVIWGDNVIFTNALVHLQIELGTTATTFEPYNGTNTTTDLGRTVYGGTLDVVSGVLTAYPFYPSYNGETLGGRWICDRAVYAEGTTPPTGSQVALISGTGTTYTLTPTEVNTLLGENNVWADSGDVEVVYVRDLNIAINNLLNSNGTRSLGMMAMSAPTETTAEEPTEEQTEDDMR